jgi:hypothetical protein
MEEKWSTVRGNERKGKHLFQKGKGACEVALGSRAEGRPEDVAAWRCVVADSHRQPEMGGV